MNSNGERIPSRRKAGLANFMWLLCLASLLCIQGYLVFYKLIPENIEIYSSQPLIQQHLKRIVHVLLNMSAIWIFLALLSPAVKIVDEYMRRRRAR
jgi:hypothetical protein